MGVTFRLYVGSSNTKVDSPDYYDVTADRVNCISITALDAAFDPVEYGPGPLTVALDFRST